MKRNPYSSQDFAWTEWTAEEIAKIANDFLVFKKEQYQKIKAIPAAERTFENTIYAIERTGVKMEDIFKISFLMNVSPSEEIRNIAQNIIDLVGKELIEIEYDEAIYRAVKEYEAKGEILEGAEKKLFSDMIREYRRMGFDLPASDRLKLQDNLKKLGEMSNLYSKNINEYKDAIFVSEEELEGLPESYKQSREKENGKYKITLEYPDFFPFMENAVRGDKRKELMDKYLHKGGEANVKLLQDILAVRDENARMLGYKNHAEFQLEVKMAKESNQVFSFIHDLAAQLEKGLENEMQTLRDFKKQLTQKEEDVLYYDVSFLVNQNRKQVFSVDTEKVREYFPLSTVLEQMFEIYGTLFSLKFEMVEGFSVWHEEVRVYTIREKDSSDLLAYFFLDLHPRAGKYGHAAVFNITSPCEVSYKSEVGRTPVAALVCNFPRPTDDRPSLLNHNEVDTLFHEFGHVLHEVLSDVRFSSQSGFSVARDFVEAPSQMLENWVWNKEILQKVSKHFVTGESLPEEMIENILKAKYHMIHYSTLRQIVFALFDMTLHTQTLSTTIDEFYHELMANYLQIQLPEGSLFSAGFGHLMGYDAGYYGYLWSKVYAADMFTRFEAEGILNPVTGKEYRKWILEKGASMEEMDLVRGFLGREPNNSAFLRELGMEK